ncbi:DUF1365 family protein [Halopseudomonas pachastrellae]|nr:DUF1365 family protein [Halopseudomonas pachastrellae]
MLTQIRSFGMLFNPVSFFYCHDLRGQLRAIICEVTNTPWGERFSYLLEADPEQQRQHFSLAKRFHVFPLSALRRRVPDALQYAAERLQVRIDTTRTASDCSTPAWACSASRSAPRYCAARQSASPLWCCAPSAASTGRPASAAQRHTVV